MKMLRIVINRIWDKVLVIGWVLCIMLPVSPLYMPLTYRDSGVYLYAGWRILNGELPYRDIWDNKPPVIFYINALGLFLSNNSRWGVWLIEFIAIFFAAIIGFRLVQKALGTRPAILSLLLWLLTLEFTIDGGNLTEEYTLPLQFACLFLVYDADKENFPKFYWFLIGMINAVAFFTKQTMIGIGLAIILYLTLHRLTSGLVKRWLYELLLIFAGSLLIFFGITAFFYLQGGLGQFWSAAFQFNFVYPTLGIRDHMFSFISGVAPLAKAGLLQFSLIGYVIGLLLIRYKKSILSNWLPLLSVGLLDLPIELILAGASGRNYLHYFMALLPVLSIFAGLTFWVFLSYLSFWNLSNITKNVFVTSLLVIFLWSSFSDYKNQIVAFNNIRDDTVIKYIVNATVPDDYVLLWGNEASVNFFSQRRSPTRFVYQYPLYNPKYVNELLVEQFLDDITLKWPRLIIDTSNRSTLFDDFPIKSEILQSRIMLIQSQYRAKENVGTWIVYEYIGGKAVP